MLRRAPSSKVALLILLCVLLGLVPRPAGAGQQNRLRVILLLDASGSMAGNDPGRLVAMAAKMLGDLADERDRVTVMSFGSQIRTLADARGSDHEGLRAAIDGLGRNEGCTDYALALEAGARQLDGPAPAGERRVVLFLTDGRFEPVGERGCRGFDGASDAERAPIVERVDGAARRFAKAGARLFTIGLGAAPERAEQSVALLRQAAATTGGQYLHAKAPRDVPPIFAGIFGALVGAPVMQEALDRGRPSLEFRVPKGADRLHVVLVPARPGDLDKVELTRDGAAVGFEPARVQAGTASSYRLARVTTAADGGYRLQGKGTGRIEVLVIPDVGLSLRLEQLPAVLPEGEPLSGRAALRTRLGDSVKLTAGFLSQVTVTVKLEHATLFARPPTGAGEAPFKSAGPLKRGKYRVTASARHALGFLDVAPVERTVSVEPRFAMTVAGPTIRFDTMAEQGPLSLHPPLGPGGALVKLVVPEKMPVDVALDVAVPADIARDIVIEPSRATFGPDKPREVALRLRWRDARALRGKARRYTGALVLTPDAAGARVLVGAKRWEVAVDGRLRAWTWRRYLEEYKWRLGLGFLLLLTVVYLVGRAMAATFPPKARLYYVEVGQSFESDSLVKRHARHGAFRSARFRFPLGKNARPLAWFQSNGAGFTVIPERGTVITALDDTLPADDREKRAPFRGAWGQRYRLGDTWEVELTRAEKQPADDSSWRAPAA